MPSKHTQDQTAGQGLPLTAALRTSSGSRRHSRSRSLSSVSSSDRESPMAPCVPRSLGSPQHAARHAVVIDHQGAGKVVHKPDGTVVWEPAPENTNPANACKGEHPLMRLVALSLATTGAVAVMVGGMTTQQELNDARANKTCLTTRHLTTVVANTVSACIAGTLTGAVLGPVMAVRSVAGALLKPAIAGMLLHQGFVLIRQWRSGVVGLLRKLQSGDSSRVLEALRQIIALARRNPRFAKEFNKLAGIEVLLQRLAEALPDCPLLHLLVQALAELCKDQDCRESLVAAGGVPRLVALLSHPNPIVGGQALSALSQLADHALAQEAIRDAGGVSRLVELASAATASLPPALGSVASSEGAAVAGPAGGFERSAMLLPAVKLLQVLAQDPVAKAAIGDAGGVSTLLAVVARAEPRSPAQSEAIVALHNALRGSPDNQRALAAIPSASEVLRSALAGYGPCWHPAKAELHALLNVLARLQGAQEAGGFIVVQSQAVVGAPAPPPAGAVQGMPARA